MNPKAWLTLSFVGCGWGHLPKGGDVTLSGATWDPTSAVAREDAVLLHLPASGGVVSLTGTTPTSVETAGYATQLVASTRTNHVAALTEKYRCTAPEDEIDGELVYASDCPSEYLQIDRGFTVVHGEQAGDSFEFDSPYAHLAFSPTGDTAVAWLSSVDEIPDDSIVNLAAAAVIDLESGAIFSLDVGYGASEVLFTDDGTRAVVLSQNRVTVLDIGSNPPTKDVSFSLTLDADNTLVPSRVALTPDGSHALITVQGQADLYILDLENPSVNLVSLPAVPADMVVDPLSDRTLIVYSNSAVVDLLDHDVFDLESTLLDEPATHIDLLADFALLSRPGSTDVVWFSPSEQDSHEFHLQGGLVRLQTSPTADRAVAFTEVGGAPGMEILNLETLDNPAPYLLPSASQDAAFSTADGATHLLVLQSSESSLLSMNLTEGGLEEIQLPDNPLSIGSLEEGGFYITHQSSSGRVSFFDPASGNIETASGFAWSNLSSQPLLESSEAE